MIGKESGQADLAAWGIEHKPGVLDRIDEELDWRKFGKTLRRVFKDCKEGRPELAAENAYAHQDARREDAEKVNGLVSDWTMSHTQAEVLEKCTAGDVPVGPINSITDIFADPHFAARENLLKVADERVGSLIIPNVVPRLSETPGRVRHLGRACPLGSASATP